jgi:hypothetical protein
VTDANGNPNSNTDVMYEVVAGGGKMSAPSAVTDEKEGIAEVSFLPGDEPGVSTIKATVMSRPASTEEIASAEGAIFLYGLDEDPGRLEVLEWLVEPKDEVVEGQDLVILEDRRGDTYTVKAPRDGIARMSSRFQVPKKPGCGRLFSQKGFVRLLETKRQKLETATRVAGRSSNEKALYQTEGRRYQQRASLLTKVTGNK